MTAAEEPTLPVLDCWSRIGSSGDRSCPELAQYVRCRNCPVHESAARAFFERPAPAGYLDEWAQALGEEVVTADREDQSYLIFRLGLEWLALATRAVVEVTAPRPVHKIPHRSNEILTGMVNLRGRLQLQVSLHGLLRSATADGGAEAAAPEGQGRGRESTPRLVVAEDEGLTWVFAADDVLGVHRFSREHLSAVPSTLANPSNSYSQAVLSWRGLSVGVLDEHRVFAALRGLGR